MPAEAATIGVVDRIFTRVGAQDDISAGQSTFMVEMVETANILHHATARSLLILDEIGRGTSTYDGLSIAWAVVEYIHNHPRLQAKTFFATHYQQWDTYLTYFNAGLRVYDISDATLPKEVAWFLPPDPVHRYGPQPVGSLVDGGVIEHVGTAAHERHGPRRSVDRIVEDWIRQGLA